MNILGTGLSGLVGSRVVELLSDEFSFTNLSKETGIDITDSQKLTAEIINSRATWVFHFAAYTDVDGAESQRALSVSSQAWKVNVLATETVVQVCRQYHKRLLYISTDYVFDGKKESYTEESAPAPQGWYAVTKYEGEKRVATLAKNALIVRIANPYQAATVGKSDFFHKILNRLESNQEVTAPTDQLFVPTFVDDIAQGIRILVKNDSHGIYHVVGSGALTPFAAARQIAEKFKLDQDLIKKTTFAEFFTGRAPRPFSAVLKNDKITRLGVHMRSFSEGLEALALQLAA